jgi:hypothetical protein
MTFSRSLSFHAATYCGAFFAVFVKFYERLNFFDQFLGLLLGKFFCFLVRRYHGDQESQNNRNSHNPGANPNDGAIVSRELGNSFAGDQRHC